MMPSPLMRFSWERYSFPLCHSVLRYFPFAFLDKPPLNGMHRNGAMLLLAVIVQRSYSF